MNSERLAIRVEPELKRALQGAAKIDRRTVSACAVLALEEWLSRHHGCDSCGALEELTFSPAHAANFCTSCFEREANRVADEDPT